MFNIGQYIAKLNNKRLNHLTKLNDICLSINNVTGLNIKVSDINIKNGILYISGLNSAEKSHIYIKKSLILKEISSVCADNIVDIR